MGENKVILKCKTVSTSIKNLGGETFKSSYLSIDSDVKSGLYEYFYECYNIHKNLKVVVGNTYPKHRLKTIREQHENCSWVYNE